MEPPVASGHGLDRAGPQGHPPPRDQPRGREGQLARLPRPGLPPGTCILATSQSSLWPASSWLFCRALQAASRNCFSCPSLLASSANLGQQLQLTAAQPAGWPGWGAKRKLGGPETLRMLPGPRPTAAGPRLTCSQARQGLDNPTCKHRQGQDTDLRVPRWGAERCLGQCDWVGQGAGTPGSSLFSQ